MNLPGAHRMNLTQTWALGPTEITLTINTTRKVPATVYAEEITRMVSAIETVLTVVAVAAVEEQLREHLGVR